MCALDWSSWQGMRRRTEHARSERLGSKAYAPTLWFSARRWHAGARLELSSAAKPQCGRTVPRAWAVRRGRAQLCDARAQALALVSDVHALAAQVRSRCKKGGGGSGGSGGRGGDGGGGGNGSVTPRGGHLGLPSACTLVERLSAAPCACLAGARAGRWAAF